MEVLQVTEAVPLFVEQEDKEILNAPITLAELEVTLKSMGKDKSPGSDGWPIEFFIAFFALIGQDLLLATEDCRITGVMPEAFNSTFLALTPKVDNPQSFDDFRPISLRNSIYIRFSPKSSPFVLNPLSQE